MGETLELTNEAREQLQELRALSEKVESGEKGAVLKLRKAVQDPAPRLSPAVLTSHGTIAVCPQRQSPGATRSSRRP